MTTSLFAEEDLPPIGAGLSPLSPYTIRRNSRGKTVHFTPPKGRSRPCDDRCTGAHGPNCSCRCGGKFHGIHRQEHSHK